MKFCGLWLIFLFAVANLKVAICYKCNFIKSYYDYTCEINSDSASIEEAHVNGMTDDDVNRLEFEGNGTANLIQLEFGQTCKRFKNLERVKINRVKSVDENLVLQFNDLKIFLILNSEIEEISENLYSSQSNLTWISISYCKLTTLPDDVFSNQKELQSLYLDDNQISFLPSNIFKSLQQLRILNLGENKIQSLNPKWFENLQLLMNLNLKRNNIKDLPKNVFTTLENLEWLDLSDNKLTTLHGDSFGLHISLKIIYIHGNKVSSIDKRLSMMAPDVDYYMSENACRVNNEEPIRTWRREPELIFCFQNYRPRGSSTASTVADSSCY